MPSSTGLVKNIVVIAIFAAASAALGLIKLPSPIGSVALDSLPGFFSAAYFAPWVGAIVGGVGHLLSAATAGFPLGPVHIIVALQTFAWCFIFGWIVRKIDRPWALGIASIVVILLNAVASPIMLVLLFPDFRPMLVGLIFYLLEAAVCNIGLAALSVWALARLQVPGL